MKLCGQLLIRYIDILSFPILSTYRTSATALHVSETHMAHFSHLNFDQVFKFVFDVIAQWIIQVLMTKNNVRKFYPI